MLVTGRREKPQMKFETCISTHKSDGLAHEHLVFPPDTGGRPGSDRKPLEVNRVWVDRGRRAWRAGH